MGLGSSSVALRSRLAQDLERRRLVGHLGERADQLVDPLLGGPLPGISGDRLVLGGRRLLDPGQPLAHRVDHEGLDDLRADRHPPRAVAGRRAPIERIAPALLRLHADDEPGSAAAAAQDAEPGEQPVRLRPSTSSRALASAPDLDVDQRLVGGGVVEPAESDLAEVDARAEHRLHAVVGALDAGAEQERPNLLDRSASGTLGEGLADHRRHIGIRLEDAVGPTTVAGRDQREGRDAASDRPGLGLGAPLLGRPALVLVDGAEQDAGHPARRGRLGDLADVDGAHLASGILDPADDLALHAQRPDQAVEVGDDQDVGVAGLDRLDGAQQANAVLERRAAAYVQLVDRLDQLEPGAVAGRGDSVALLARRHEGLALASRDAGHPHNADRPPRHQGDDVTS